MGVDWEYLRSVTEGVDEWSTEELEEIYQNLSGVKGLKKRDKSIEKLELLFTLTQTIMVAKWEQVSSMKKEMKQLAESAGRMDAQRENELLEEISKLTEMLQASTSGKRGRSEESQFPYDWSTEWRAKKQQLEEKLIEKNAEIDQLVDNLMTRDDQIRDLESDVSNLQTQLSRATNEINSMASECLQLKKNFENAQGNISISARKISSLEARNTELKDIKADVETKYEELSAQVDSRVEKLVEVLENKEREISKLKNEIHNLRMHKEDRTSVDVKHDKGDIVQHQKEMIIKLEQEIEILTKNLSKATKEIDKDEELISALKRNRRSIEIAESEEILKLRSELNESNSHIKRLQRQLVSAEDDAQVYAKDFQTAFSELKAMMYGEINLADAVGELKETRHQLNLRSSEIEELTTVTNVLQININSLIDENMELREQLRLEPRDDINLPGVRTTDWKNSKSIIERLTSEVYQLQEEKVSLRTTIYELTREVSNLKKLLEEAKAYQGSREDLCVEDPQMGSSMKEQMNQLQSLILRLTQQQIDRREDTQETKLLKEKCQRLEDEKMKLEKMLNDEDDDTSLVQEDQQTTLLAYKRNRKKFKKILQNLPLSSEETMARLKTQVKFLLEEINNKEFKVHKEEHRASKYDKYFQDLHSEVQKLNDQLIEERERSQKEIDQMKEECHNSAALKVALESQITELKIYINESQVNPEEAANKLALRDAEHRYEFELSRRMIKVYQKEIELLESRLQCTKNQQFQSEKMIKEVKNKLLVDTLRFNQKIMDYKEKLSNSVSAANNEAVNAELVAITAKYRAFLNNQMVQNGDRIEQRQLELQIENERLERHKTEDLNNEMRQKIISLETSLSIVTGKNQDINPKIELLSKQLANVERRELVEKKKAKHAVAMHENAKQERNELHRHLKETESANKKLAEINATLQQNEAKLQDQLAKNTSERIEILNKELRKLKKNKDDSALEIEQLKGTLEVSQVQLKHYQERCHSLDAEVKAIKRKQEDLAALSEEKAHIAILHLELSQERTLSTELKSSLAETKRNLEQSEVTLARVKSEHLSQEEEWTKALDYEKYKVQRLIMIIKDLRVQFAGAVPLPQIEKLSELMEELRYDKSQLKSSLEIANKDRKEARLLQQEIKVKYENLDDITNYAKDSTGTQQSFSEWSKKLEEVRLQNVRLKEKINDIEEEEHIARILLDAKEKKCLDLQEKLTILEQLWVEQQTIWEQHLIPKEKKTFSVENKTSSDLQQERVPSPHYREAISMWEKRVDLKDQEIELLKQRNICQEEVIEELRAKICVEDRSNELEANTDNNDLRFQTIISGLKDRLQINEETLSEAKNTIKNYQSEIRETRAHHKMEIQHLSSEKTELERKLRDLQSEMDNIPVKHSVDLRPENLQMEIYSLKQDIKTLEQRLENSKQDRLLAEDEVGKIERELNNIKREKNEEKRKLEISSEITTQQKNREIERLSRKVKSLEEDKENMIMEVKQIQENVIRSPSLILKTLVEKLRDQLIDKEMQIANLSRSLKDIQDSMEFHENKIPTRLEEKPERDHEPVNNDYQDQKENLNEIEMLKKKLEKYKEIIKEKEEATQRNDQAQETTSSEYLEMKNKLDAIRNRKNFLEKEILKLRKDCEDKTNQLAIIGGKSPESMYQAIQFLTNRLEKMEGGKDYLEAENERQDRIKEKFLEWDVKKKLENSNKKLREKVNELLSVSVNSERKWEQRRELLVKLGDEKCQLRAKILKLNKIISDNLCGKCSSPIKPDFGQTFTITKNNNPLEKVNRTVDSTSRCTYCSLAQIDQRSSVTSLRGEMNQTNTSEEIEQLKKKLKSTNEELRGLKKVNEQLKRDLLNAQQVSDRRSLRPSSAPGNERSSPEHSDVIPERDYPKFKRPPPTLTSRGTASIILNYQRQLEELENELIEKRKILSRTKTILQEAKTEKDALVKHNEELMNKVQILLSVPDGSEYRTLQVELRQAKIVISRLQRELDSLYNLVDQQR